MHSALKSEYGRHNKVQIIYGLFKCKKVKYLVKNCTLQGSRLFDVPEEKRTDNALSWGT